MTHTRELGVVLDAIDDRGSNDTIPKLRGLETQKSGGCDDATRVSLVWSQTQSMVGAQMIQYPSCEVVTQRAVVVMTQHARAWFDVRRDRKFGFK